VVRKKGGGGKRIVDGVAVDREQDLLLRSACLTERDLDLTG
jgi:hypothetical protein